jgi:hypothetical protein
MDERREAAVELESAELEYQSAVRDGAEGGRKRRQDARRRLDVAMARARVLLTPAGQLGALVDAAGEFAEQ